MTTPPTTSSTPTSSSSSSNEKSESSYTDSDFLFFDETPKVDATPEAAAGINFLFTRFPYAVHTFQFFPSKATFATSDKEAALKECLKRNTAGDDVYFMVNEGDGVSHEENKTSVRCAAAIHELKWCYIDTDNCPVEKVEAYLKSLGLTPHIKIQSSNFKEEGPRFHIYFQLDPVNKTPTNLVKWESVQSIVARLGDFTLSYDKTKKVACDPSMKDHSKLLRVPGFSHVEKSSLVCVVDDRDFQPYTLEDLFEITGAQQLIDYCQAESGTNGHSTVPSLTEKVSYGGRFDAVRALGMHLANQPISEEEKLAIFTKFCINNLDNKDPEFVYPNGTLTPYCMGLLTSGVKKKAKEVAIQVTELQSTAEEAPPTEEDVVSKNIADRFDLSDSTYDNAPNGFGDVVGQIKEHMLYPSSALAFATGISGAALLKSICHRTPLGSSCNLYVVAVASTCSGKSDPKTILQNTFVDLKYTSLLQNDFRSGAAIGTHLESTGGVGMYIKDEIGYLLAAIQNPKADKNDSAITSKLLEVYTAGADKQVSFGKLANTGKKGGNKEIRVDYPTIGIMGYTTYSGFSKMFTQASILSGLFQRFIIVSAPFSLNENPGRDLSYTVKSSFFPKGIMIVPPADLENTDESEATAVTTRKLITLSYTPEAARRAADVRQHYRQLILKIEKEEPGSLKGAIYGRHAENTERIASVLCGPNNVIDIQTYDWACSFMASKQDALLSIVDDISEGGTESKVLEEQEKIRRGVLLDCKKTGYPVGRYRDVWQNLKRTFTQTYLFDRALEEGKKLGNLKIIPTFIPTGKDKGFRAIQLINDT